MSFNASQGNNEIRLVDMSSYSKRIDNILKSVNFFIINRNTLTFLSTSFIVNLIKNKKKI